MAKGDPTGMAWEMGGPHVLRLNLILINKRFKGDKIMCYLGSAL
jgi:hypothetical protein